MEFAQFLDWAFKALLTGVAIYLANIVSTMRDSIDGLHKAVAVEIEKANWIMLMIDKTEKRLDKIEERVSDVERHQPNNKRG